MSLVNDYSALVIAAVFIQIIAEFQGIGVPNRVPQAGPWPGPCPGWAFRRVPKKRISKNDKTDERQNSIRLTYLKLGTGSQNYKCPKYVISWLHNAGIAITSIIKQTRRFYV